MGAVVQDGNVPVIELPDPQDDLVGIGFSVDADEVLDFYRRGWFPMPIGEHERSVTRAIGPFAAPGESSYFLWSPQRRGVLPIDGLRVPRSLRKMVKRYAVTINTAFDRVIDRCGDPGRSGGWIDDGIVELYTELHQRGQAHSVETWDVSGRLVGGLYGVSVAGLFAGESMFHDPEHGRDASKVALLRLMQFIHTDPHAGQRLFDVQFQTSHLASLGVVEVPRDDYQERLARALELPPLAWPAPGEQSARVPPPRTITFAPPPAGRPVDDAGPGPDKATGQEDD